MKNNFSNNAAWTGYRIVATLLFGLAALSTLPSIGAENAMPDTTKIVLKDTSAQSTNLALNKVSVWLEADAVQKEVSQGLHLQLVFKNTGDQVVEFKNPQDLTQMLIIDSNGWPVEIPRTVPEILIHRRQTPDERAATHKPVRLEPGQTHVVHLEVQKVEQRSKASDAASVAVNGNTPKIWKPITAGSYSVSVSTILIAVVNGSTSPEGSRILNSDRLTIKLGS